MTGRESHLHKALKEWYMEEGDVPEARVDGIIADILRPGRKRGERDLVIEIQTGSFSKLLPKLPALLDKYRVCLVYPLTSAKRLVLYGSDGTKEKRERMSPKHDTVYAIFNELFRIPQLLGHRHFRFEAVMTVLEEIRVADGTGSWRRGGVSIKERRLVEVSGVERFERLSDYKRLIPEDLRKGFTCSRLAKAAGCAKSTAQKMAYCLSRAGLIRMQGKQGREHLYVVREAKNRQNRPEEYVMPGRGPENLRRTW